MSKKPPFISVNLGSNRPGGIDISLAGLKAQTFEDFEVIFVDGLYHQRHSEVLEEVKRSGLKQPFYHVPNHRYGTSGLWGTTCAGYNTGFMLSAGEIIVMLLDYAYAPPTWLEEHAKHQLAGRKIVMAPHIYRTIDRKHLYRKDEAAHPIVEFTREIVDLMGPWQAAEAISRQKKLFDKISILENPFEADHLDRFPVETGDAKAFMTTGPASVAYFNTKNESFPREAVFAINGMDEHYDLGRGPGDPDLARRLAMLGMPCWVVKEAPVHCLNPRRLMPNMNIIIEDNKLPPPHDKRWNVAEGNAYFDRKTAEGKMTADNPFELRTRRDEIWGWREQSQSPGNLSPGILRISDFAYFLPSCFPPERKPDVITGITEQIKQSPHLFDPKTQLNYIVWHNDPKLEQFIRHAIETIKPDRWVETGTHMGWTSMWVAANYPWLPIYTTEIDAEFYQKSKENLDQFPQVSLTHASSPDFLARMYPVLKQGLTMFWLDAHWWPPVPLRQECKIVASLEKYVCLLDDFSCWDPDFSGDTFYGRAPNFGSCHLNDLYYVGPELGYSCWRPCWEPQPGSKGVGMFLKGVDYQPPINLMKWDSIETLWTPPGK